MNPTLKQLTDHLINDEGWTQEEVDQLTGYYFRLINKDGTTEVDHDMWDALASSF